MASSPLRGVGARSLAAGTRAPRREQDRPSRLRLWLRRRRGMAKPTALALLGAAALGAVGLGLYLADPAGRVQAVAEGAAEWGVAAGLIVGRLDVAHVENDRGVVPPLRTEAELIRAALGVRSGDPILGFSPAEARERLETLPWIERAHVERRLPGTIFVRIKEREAFAIWQNGGRFAVIDREGRTVTTEALGAFAGLPLVVGAGAERHAAALHDLLLAHKPILDRTQALVRVGERRWNLRLHSGTDVMLPEGQEAPALNRLSELHARNALLDRPLLAIDMRLPDRLVLRQPPAPEPPPQQRRTGGNRG